VLGVITETDIFKAFIDLYRAGHSGLYLTLQLPERRGLMGDLSKALLRLGGDIVGISSSYDQALGTYRLVIKGEGVDKDRVVALFASLGHPVLEVRELP
jgi:acetoin utilization protein AcuB